MNDIQLNTLVIHSMQTEYSFCLYRSYERFKKIFLFVDKRAFYYKGFDSLADPSFGSLRFPLCRYTLWTVVDRLKYISYRERLVETYHFNPRKLTPFKLYLAKNSELSSSSISNKTLCSFLQQPLGQTNSFPNWEDGCLWLAASGGCMKQLHSIARFLLWHPYGAYITRCTSSLHGRAFHRYH